MKIAKVPIIILIINVLSISTIAQNLISTEFRATYSKFATNLIIGQNAKYEVDEYYVNYTTTDLNGNPTTVSGLFWIPNVPSEAPIAIYDHGTVTKRNEVPSENSFEKFIGLHIASQGYFTAMPDYIGLGINQNFHPYLHGETQATSGLDIIRALREHLDADTSSQYGNEVYITGYSQGGHAAMATSKYVQQNQLENEFKIAGVYSGSGPYHLSGAQALELLKDMEYSAQAFLPYVILSYQAAYGNIYNSLSDVFQSPYDVGLDTLFDGTHSLDEINSYLPNKVSEYLNPSFLTNMLQDSTTKSSPLWQALLANDNYNWVPNSPHRLLSCVGDETVFPVNTYEALQFMTAASAPVDTVEGGNLGHVDCAGVFLSEVTFYLDSIQALMAPSSASLLSDTYIKVYPVPTTDYLRIESTLSEPIEYGLINIAGVKVRQGMFIHNEVIDVENLASGIYLLGFSTKNGMQIKKVIIE
jgi:hypothetical protein